MRTLRVLVIVLLVAPILVGPAAGAAGSTTVTLDVPAGGWALVLLQATSHDPTAWVSWNVQAQPGEGAAAYFLPAGIVDPVSTAAPRSPWAPTILGGEVLAEGRDRRLDLGGGPAILVALAASTGARAELTFHASDGPVVREVASERGTGALVAFAQSPVDAAAALAAHVDGDGPGWLSLHLDARRAQADGVGAVVTAVDGSAHACELDAAGVEAPVDPAARTSRMHVAREAFHALRGEGALVLAMAQVPAETSAAVAFLPRPENPALRFEGDVTTAYAERSGSDEYTLYGEDARCVG